MSVSPGNQDKCKYYYTGLRQNETKQSDEMIPYEKETVASKNTKNNVIKE